MKKLGLLMMVAVVLNGCGSPATWRKQGVSKHDTESALARCENDSRKAKPRDEQELNQLISSCMKGEGYRFR